MTPDEALKRAWTLLAPGRDQSAPLPRGFWPDLAVVAVHEALGLPLPPDFRPTRCERGSYPQPAPAKNKAKSRAENTAALLAGLDLKL